ncbi:putative capsid protein [Bipolaris maydis chrysovirus 1]|uniref:Putative capsid protein n=1 Tax=Bipolaris maydis chrysovirus 1 TaxID=1982874 RepID=A0A1W6HVZ5_9VIRU|nr:putative capsid protein [Bipolaris maydis chrysovirus 1]
MADMFNAGKYDRRQAIYMAVRAGAPAFKKAVETVQKLEHWDPTKLPSKMADGKPMLFKGLQAVESYMERYSASSLDALSEEKNSFGYGIFGDIRRPAMLGANTVGIDVTVEWGSTEVDAEMHNGENRKMIVSTNTTTVRNEQGKDRAGLSKATGWDRTECYSMSPSDVQTLCTLIDTGRAGFNKYTRLVKGMLVYLDLLSNGKQAIKKRIPNMISYDLRSVLDSYQHRDRSYIYCSNPDSPEYRVVLSLMSEAYPNDDMTCYGVANIPADGETNVIVVNGAAGSSVNYHVELTPQMVMASITQYATESGIADELESALVCASSLYHNRYLARVGLPRVVSSIDLIMPMFRPANEVRCARPSVARELAVSIGKLHQMCMFLTIKDILVAARGSTKAGFNYSSVVESYLTTQEEVVSVMNASVTPLRLLEMTPQMKWMYKIDAEAMQDLDSLSIFEVFWLCDGGVASVRNGGVMAFKKGVSDMMTDNPYHDILRKELAKSNVVFDFSKLPKGNFTIASRYIRDTNEVVLPKLEYVTKRVKIARECDYNPNDRVEHMINNRTRVTLSARKEAMESGRTRVAWEDEEVERPTGKGSDESESVLRYGSSDGRSSPGIEMFGLKSEARERLEKRRSLASPPPFRQLSESASTRRAERLSVSSHGSRRSISVDLESVKSNVEEDDDKTPTQSQTLRKRFDFSQLKKAVEEKKMPGSYESTPEKTEPVVTVDKIQGVKNSMGIGEEVENDQRAIYKADIVDADRINGIRAANFRKLFRDRFSEEEVPPSVLARLMAILKNVGVRVSIGAMSASEINTLMRMRDGYDRSYRSSESGHNREFRESDGRVLTLEINLRQIRCSKNKIPLREADETGLIPDHIARKLGREFFMAHHERDLILARVV